jgi:ATP-dependent RNA helicase RhlB
MPIQERTLPLSLAGRDVAGQAQTGTGKTAAFLITLFSRLLRSQGHARALAPRALVIAPTRELVVQIAADAAVIGAETGLAVHAVYGGVDYRKQRDILGAGVDVLIGTPGRLIDYLKQRVYTLDAAEVLVIDEADRMFDMGFIRDLRFLLHRLPPVDRRQSMLFSATLSLNVMELAYEFMNDPERVTVTPDQVTAENVEHLVYHVGNDEKLGLLLGYLAKEASGRTLVFTNMKRTADDVVRALQANGFEAGAITGDVEQRKRLRILSDFKEGRLPLLVATDVASRGLHIPGVTHVINYDLPQDAEDYVHRSGRTARAGASGHAISLVCEDYADSLEAIEAYVGFKLPWEIPGPELIVTPAKGSRMSRFRPGRGRSSGPGRGRSSGPSGGRSSAAGGGRPPRRPAAHAKEATPAAPAPAGGSSETPPKRRRRRRRRGGATPTIGSPDSGA